MVRAYRAGSLWLLAILAPSAGVGCNGDDKAPSDTGPVDTGPDNTSPVAIDRDQDGALEEDDCDDDDPLVYPGADEVCDGRDNDCNEGVDDIGDVDGDGVSDCEDAECSVDEAAGQAIKIDATCLAPDGLVVKDPWNVVEEWTYTSTGGALVMPAIGNLTDDNKDGLIDAEDVPDIAFTNYSSSQLVVVSGDGSGALFTLPNYWGAAGVAIADVDGDGVSELIAMTTGRQIHALDGAGTVKWASATVSVSQYPQPTVADLDADGDVEVIFDAAVVNGADGTTVTSLSGINASWRTPVVADIDQDGTMEILLGEAVFSHEGALEWSGARSGSGAFAAVADVDGDPGGEVYLVSGTQMNIYDPDGTLLYGPLVVPGSNPGPPSVADFDGDGSVEIAVAANTNISVFELDGSQVWTMPIADSSGLAGCSGFDVDGDGRYEVLYADQSTFWIFDGSDGTVLYSNDSHNSGTLWEYPVVADVDLDGSAEIVVASAGGTWDGIAVLGHNGDGWPRSGTTWPVHDFAVTNINPDGTVPTAPIASWLVDNTFRARPSVDTARSDLQIRLTDACLSSCEADVGTIGLSVQLENHGAAAITADISAAILADGVEVAGFTYKGGLPGGTRSEAIALSVPWADLIGRDLALLVDTGSGGGKDTIIECVEDNNAASWEAPVCE